MVRAGEGVVEAQLHGFAGAGVTDFNAAIYGPQGSDPRRSYELLAKLAKGAVSSR